MHYGTRGEESGSTRDAITLMIEAAPQQEMQKWAESQHSAVLLVDIWTTAKRTWVVF